MSNLFRVITADLPWEYNDRRATRKDNPQEQPRFGVGAPGNYNMGCMKLQDLCDMGSLVRQVSTPDAYLFLWATCPLLYGKGKKPDPPRVVMDAWGFQYRGVAFYWTKTNLRAGTPFRGPGHYVPQNLEVVLLGTRGRPWHKTKGVRKPVQEIRVPHPRWPQGKPPCPRTGKKRSGKIIHSRKPEEFQDRVDAWLRPFSGPGPFLELFATRYRPDLPPWVCLGGELTNTDIRDDLGALCLRNMRKMTSEIIMGKVA